MERRSPNFAIYVYMNVISSYWQANLEDKKREIKYIRKDTEKRVLLYIRIWLEKILLGR